MADTIKVAIRVRPHQPRDGDGGECIKVFGPLNQIRITNGSSTETFTFDYIADQHVKQHVVYCNIAESIVEGCLDGYNGTIFAYGQTGSGKTFTMIGPMVEGSDRGLMPRAFERLYMGIQQREQECSNGKLEYLCKASFLEIYNENIVDLLDPKKAEGINLNHHIREDLKRGVYIEHLTEEICESAAACSKVLQRGIQCRTQAETQMNRESSRSHAVFCLDVESKHTTPDNLVNFRRARLNLVDLAGSERQKSTGVVGKQLKEGCHINKSLSALGCVINALVEVSQGRARHVPFRDSKLTFLLKDSLGGNSRTTVVATVHPNCNSFGETLSTLKFAQRAKWVKNQPIVNEDMTNDVQALKAEIHRLRSQLEQQVHEASAVISRPSTPAVDMRPMMVACQAEGLPRAEAMERVVEWLSGQLQDAQTAVEHEKEKREQAEGVVEAQRGQLQCLQMCCNWVTDGPDTLGEKGEVLAHLNACFEGSNNPFAAELLTRCRSLEAELAAVQANPNSRRIQEMQQALQRQVDLNTALHTARQDAVAQVKRHAEEQRRWEARLAEQTSLQSALEAALKRAAASEERHKAAMAGLHGRLEQEEAQVQRLTAALRIKENETALWEGRVQASQTLLEQKLSHAKEERLSVVQQLRAELEAQEAVVSALKLENTQQVEDLQAQRSALQECCAAKQQDIEELEGRLDLSEQQCEGLRAALEKCQRTEQALRDALEDGESCAKSTVAEYECRMETLHSEVAKLRCEVAALQSAQGTQDLELEMLAGQMRHREREAAEEVRKRDRHVEVLRQECERLSGQLPAGRSVSVALHNRRRSSQFTVPLQKRSASAMPKCWPVAPAALPEELFPGRASLCNEPSPPISSPSVLLDGDGREVGGVFVGRRASVCAEAWSTPSNPPEGLSEELDFERAVEGSRQALLRSSVEYADAGTWMSECDESDCDDDEAQVPQELLSSPCNRLLGGRGLPEVPRKEMKSLFITAAHEAHDMKRELAQLQVHNAQQRADWEKYREQRRQEMTVMNELIESLKEQLAGERERHSKKIQQLAKQEEENAVLQQSNGSLKDAISELTKLRNQNTRIHMFERSMKENSQLKEEQLALKEKIKRLQEEKDECLKKLQSSQMDKENVSPNLVSVAPHAKRRRVVP
eukprot:GGOE01007697.1.p1 GENE.GGOE01007697.1~~GGOE01007697.1.p1  ORF type:complete len:1150 (-),score=363.23 GGOE01007697.1:442-3891(-)